MIDESIEAGETYMRMRKKNLPFNHCIYFTMISNYLKKNMLDKVGAYIDDALINASDNLDVALAQCEYGIITKNIDHVTAGGKRYINLFKTYQEKPEIKGNNFIFTFTPEILAYVVSHLGLCMVDEGLRNILTLQNILPNTSEKYSDELLTEVASNLNKMGVNLKVSKGNKNA